jgi:hypothetical protein
MAVELLFPEIPRPPDLPIEIPIYWDEVIEASIAIYC